MIAIFIISGLGALSSLIAEYIFDLKPCLLCLIQRGFHLALLPVALWLNTVKLARKICLTLLAASFLVATYHTLIQLHLIQDRCQTRIKDFASYKAALAKPISCSENNWKLGNIPIAAINAIASAALFIFIQKRKIP